MVSRCLVKESRLLRLINAPAKGISIGIKCNISRFIHLYINRIFIIKYINYLIKKYRSLCRDLIDISKEAN